MENEDRQAPWRFLIGFVVGLLVGAIMNLISSWLMGRNFGDGLMCNSLTFGLIFGVVMLQAPHLIGYD